MVRLSNLNAQLTLRFPELIQSERITLPTSPSDNEKNIIQEKIQEMQTRIEVTTIDTFSPIKVCKKPEITAPNKGKKVMDVKSKVILS